jgi:hypothetical protein
MRKLAKVNRPGFLGDIKVETVDVGNTAPSFSRPMLKELTVDGDASMEIQIKYTGCFKLTIGTTVSVRESARCDRPCARNWTHRDLSMLHNNRSLDHAQGPVDIQCRSLGHRPRARRNHGGPHQAAPDQPDLVRLYDHAAHRA